MKVSRISFNSSRWLERHINDKYVKQAKENGFRSRAWFKLAEIQKSDKIFQSGWTVLDLGASPGSWSQYAMTKIGKTGRIFACDLLSMNSISGVKFLQGDFCDDFFLKKLFEQIEKKIQVCMSDAAPNISGKPIIDIPRTMRIAEKALEICFHLLSNNGNFVVKLFQGIDFEEYLKRLTFSFNKVKVRKPKSSRSNSREVYVVATGYNPE